MPGQASNAHRVSSLGLSPAEARKLIVSDASPPTEGEEVKGLLNPRHVAAIRQEIEGFAGAAVDGTVEDGPELAEPPSPSKAMEMIRELSQQRIQIQSEYDAALVIIQRYRELFGELD